jgi:hypothetical protein
MSPLTPALIAACKGDTRFPPPNYHNTIQPLKMLTSSTYYPRIFYTLILSNSCPEVREIAKDITTNSATARMNMNPDPPALLRIHQAMRARPPKLEMLSEGSRGRIWHVADDGGKEMEIVGCVLGLGKVKMPDGKMERFRLFGVGHKEIKDDVLLISESG